MRVHYYHQLIFGGEEMSLGHSDGIAVLRPHYRRFRRAAGHAL